MSKFKVGSPEFIAEARSFGLDPYEYFYVQMEIAGKNTRRTSDRIMKGYISVYIMPMLNEWAGFFDYIIKEEKTRLRRVNKLLKEFCNNMGYTVKDYPDHYANLRGYESWQKFRKGENKGFCRSLRQKYCETKDPNSLFLSLDTLRYVTGCKIPVKNEERIKKELWLQKELKKIEEQKKMEMKKEKEEEKLRKIERYDEHNIYIRGNKNTISDTISIGLSSRISQIKYEVRIIGGKPHKCKTDHGVIIKDCGQYDIFKRLVIGPPLLTDEELIQKSKYLF